MTQPNAYPPYPPNPHYPPNPQNRPDLGRAGCLPATLAAAPFLLIGVVCVVLAVIAFATPSNKPVPNPNTSHTGSVPAATSSVPDDVDPTSGTSTTTKRSTGSTPRAATTSTTEEEP